MHAITVGFIILGGQSSRIELSPVVCTDQISPHSHSRTVMLLALIVLPITFTRPCHMYLFSLQEVPVC